MIKTFIKLSFFRFSFSAGFYGLAFHISHLFGSKYVNLALSATMDAIVVSSLLWIVPRRVTICLKLFINPCRFVSKHSAKHPLICRYGRRRPLILFFFVCSVANTICSFIVSRFGECFH